MPYHVKTFFEVHPKLKEVFETYDGVLHPTRPIAESWISRHAHKTINVHQRPVKENPEQKKDGITALVDTLKTTSNALAKGLNGGKGSKGTVIDASQGNEQNETSVPSFTKTISPIETDTTPETNSTDGAQGITITGPASSLENVTPKQD